MKKVSGLMAAAALALALCAAALASCKSEKKGGLWALLDELKADYEWVDLSREVSPETVHWPGFDPLEVSVKYSFEDTYRDFGSNENNSFLAYLYTLPGQYGTHTDVPGHFDPAGRTTDRYGAKELAYPLVVVDKTAAVAADPGYALTAQDLRDFEAAHGKIPAGAFVVFRSGWSKVAGKEARYPGWDIGALEFLVSERDVAGVGHETPDTDPSAVGESDVGMIGENYVLDHGKLNVELLQNLDTLPVTGAVIFITFPLIKDGTGFTSRVFAIAPKG
ncbi:MAG: cyclase family protein [Treponema sp.]|jgi:kynurenine formamidase|nr:cyclase family protein [Treponema sp.]